MITAASVYVRSNMSPSDLGEDIVPANLPTYADKKAAAINHIATEILPGAESEVLTPLLTASGGTGLPLSDAAIARRYPEVTDPSKRTAINTTLSTLYDNAVLSYARAELYKQISTTAKGYDEDAVDFRKTGDDQLKKLLAMVDDILHGEPESSSPESARGNSVSSTSVSTSFGF